MGVRWKYILVILSLIASLVWIAVFTFPEKNLHLIACDVGQGDATLVIFGKTQILIDGGPDSKVLDCLGKYLPFFDRKIEAVVLSHPQKDHFGGIIDVIDRYEVEVLIATPIDSGSREWQVLKSLVGGRGIRVINPIKDMRIGFGLIHLDILHPSVQYILSESVQMNESKDLAISNVLGAYTTSRDPNDFSVVGILSYKNFDALFTGDIGPAVSDRISVNQLIKDVEYIKIPHHGSRNGLTKSLLDAASPKVAVISAGKENPYGHPHEEVIKLLRDKEVRVLRTDLDGDIEVVTDGNRWQVKK